MVHVNNLTPGSECNPTDGFMEPDSLLAPNSPLHRAMTAETLYGVVLDVKKTTAEVLLAAAERSGLRYAAYAAASRRRRTPGRISVSMVTYAEAGVSIRVYSFLFVSIRFYSFLFFSICVYSFVYSLD
jgi:hypothetical protein